VSKTTRRAIVIALGAGLFAVVVGEWMAWRRAESRYQHSLAAHRQLERQLGEVQTDRERLREALAGEQARIQQLSEAFSAKSQELQRVIDRLTEEETIVRELQEKLLVMQRQVEQLQGELALNLQERTASSPTGKTVQLEKVVVAQPTSTSPAGSQGRVLSVHPQWRFVVTDLGWDVVKIGDVISIYRNEQLLGKARIERVQEEVSAATLLPEWTETEIQINDVVRIL